MRGPTLWRRQGEVARTQKESKSARGTHSGDCRGRVKSRHGRKATREGHSQAGNHRGRDELGQRKKVGKRIKDKSIKERAAGVDLNNCRDIGHVLNSNLHVQRSVLQRFSTCKLASLCMLAFFLQCVTVP